MRPIKRLRTTGGTAGSAITISGLLAVGLLVGCGAGTTGITVPATEPPTDPYEHYDTALDAAKTDSCKWYSLGTCGEWLIVSPSTGYTADVHFYDAETGERVAVCSYTDVVESFVPCIGDEPECELVVQSTSFCEGE